MQTQQQTQFQPSYYGWMEAEIIHAEGKTSRAGHAMTHVKVRTEADDIYDGYLTSSGYRELSRQMFLILEEYAPTLVPYSIDEGFLDLSTMDAHVWRNTTPAGYVQKIRSRIMRETRLPIRAAVKWAAHLR